MKTAIIFLTMTFLSLPTYSKTLSSTRTDTKIEASRVVELIKLVNKEDIKVSLVVQDNGGSTDVSPTQKLFFTIYSKGEMTNTDATFDLGYIYELLAAKRVSGGIYEVEVSAPNEESSMPENQTLVIDAQKAIIALKAVYCEEYACPASTEFESTIEVEKK